MPTYTTFETISTVIHDKKVTRWKVLDDNEELLNLVEVPLSTPPADVANTLKIFLDSLNGTTFVRVFLFDPKFKGQKGGDTSNSVFRYYYKLSPLKADSPLNGMQNGNGLGIADYLGLHAQLSELNTKLAVQAKDAEIAELKRNNKANRQYGYLEKMADQFGRGFYKEMKKKDSSLGDIDEDEDEGEDNAPVIKKKATGKKKQLVAEKTESKPVTKEDYSKRSADAIKRLTKIAGLEVVNGLEEMADLAENEPAKLMELLQQLKGEE